MDAAAVEPDTHEAASTSATVVPGLKRLASQFALLSVAEVVCRVVSLAIVLELVRRVGRDGYGRIEFCFNLVYWLIFIIRDGVELVFYRELSRRTRLNPRIIGAYVSLKLQVALVLWAGLAVVSLVAFREAADRVLLCSFGILLIPTAVGLDNVFRSRGHAGIVAISLTLRSSLYALGVWYLVTDPSRLIWVPWLFFAGESLGISLIWCKFAAEFGMPRLSLRRGRRIAGPVLAQGQGILGLQLSQVMLSSLDVMIIGFLDSWSLVGLYGAPHRIVSAAVTFAVIFQQVLLPQLVRSWATHRNRQTAEIRWITIAAMVAIVPVAAAVSFNARQVVDLLFTPDFVDAVPLLAIGIWRVPIMVVGSIHITTLVATHREREGLRILSGCLAIAVPLVLAAHSAYGLTGTASAMVIVALLVAMRTAHAVHGRKPVRHLDTHSSVEPARFDSTNDTPAPPHANRGAKRLEAQERS